MKSVLKFVTVSFPNVFNRSKYNNSFDCTFIFDEDSDAHKTLENDIAQVGKEKYADKWASAKKSIIASGKYPVRDGNIKADKYSGYADRLFISAKHTIAPQIVNRDATPITESDGIIYAGAIVHAHIDVSVFENSYGKFVGLRLLGLQFVKDGERLSSEPTADLADFKPLTDGIDADDL